MELKGEIDFTRQRDWLDPTKISETSVTICGCGGIGSFTAIALSKLGIPKLTLIDPDIIEVHNIPSQFYIRGSEGHPKVEELALQCTNFGASEIDIFVAKITEEGFEAEQENEFPTRLRGIVIAALDSMKARKDLWNQVKGNIRIPLFIDSRLGGTNIVIYSGQPHNPEFIKKYEESLFSDEEARPESCTRQAIIDVGFQVSSLLTRNIRKHLAGEEVESEIFFDQDQLIVMKRK